MRDIQFEQLPLFSGGHHQITVELTLHLDGPTGTIEVGYSIHETSGVQQIEMGTLGVLSIHASEMDMSPVLSELVKQAKMHLLPF